MVVKYVYPPLDVVPEYVDEFVRFKVGMAVPVMFPMIQSRPRLYPFGMISCSSRPNENKI